jgi:choline-sulfatase
VKRAVAGLLLLCAAGACSGERTGGPAAPPPGAQNLLLITVDTLRADRVGAYGDRTARTPVMDALAARGARFSNAFAVAPITLPAHASIMTGRYPAGHGARHNGIRIDLGVPTLADSLGRQGFSTAAFVGAFPLDRRFGLIKGFQKYGDRMPRGPDGRTANERPGRLVVDDAIAWVQGITGRFFLWVHLFDPHAPYGDARAGAPAASRYAGEITETDRQIGRLLDALQPRMQDTLVALAADHGEAFGEHGEIAHSIFVYDTTLRIPLILAGPGIRPGAIERPVTQVDIAPTLLRLAGLQPFDHDGIDLLAAEDARTRDRTIYAESFAPLLDFGWSPLRAVRAGGWKYIAAPRPELYRVAQDTSEAQNVIASEGPRAATMQAQADRFSSVQLELPNGGDREAAARLQALGYASGSRTEAGRPDPKDRRALAARIAQVTSGEYAGAELEKLLRQVLADDPKNPLANLRMGYVLLESNRCAPAATHFAAAIASKYPSADPHMGLAACHAARRDYKAAAQVLRDADAVEPGNPIVLANLGLMLSDGGDPAAAVDPLQRALSIDPDLHQGRFGLAIAFARSGRRAEAAAQAEELLRRLPPSAPQRPEVERLLAAVR